MALWTPASLSTAPRLWCKADDLGLADGASVTSWTDSSGNGQSVFTPSWASSPTFKTGQLNFMAIVRFTTAQALRFVEGGLSIPFSLFVLARTTGGTIGRVVSGFADTSANWVLGWDTTREDDLYMAGYVHNPGTTVTSVWHMYGANTDGATWNWYREGALLASNAGAAIGIDSRISLNGAYENSANAQSECEFAEIIVCNYVLSAADRQSMEGYLAWKWGRQAALPVTHPYSSAAPGIGALAGANYERKGDRRA